ncbi:hypothetical protein K32_26950 [Kaistia sp. 32K]|uniref:DUF3253 domain-containing protein n=1 Tax=Kaistia sp. 32K TaxID=2795690 RepID=UPI00191681C6|nr:DUF3253 domain-containing protein [Kaistia sp. 32K]BCP54078.1 hypothetical protein K32_26950 [Kaistia sp. 32K]
MKTSISHEQLQSTLLDLLAALPAGKSVDPTEVARAVAGGDEKIWRLQMVPIRAIAVRLAEEGKVSILRKGKPVDPRDFKGVYRIGHPVADAPGSDIVE